MIKYAISQTFKTRQKQKLSYSQTNKIDLKKGVLLLLSFKSGTLTISKTEYHTFEIGCNHVAVRTDNLKYTQACSAQFGRATVLVTYKSTYKQIRIFNCILDENHENLNWP
jgi:hypothetical protein